MAEGRAHRRWSGSGNPVNTQLQESYRYCTRVSRTCARNFYFGFLMLPQEKRRSLCAIYAFMRACDDAVDDAPPCERPQRLRAVRDTLEDALAGDTSAAPYLPAFRDAVRRHHIPAEHFRALLTGAEMDLSITRYPTFESLHRYCYHVASVVGLVCLHVFGFEDEAARQYAEDCGVAFQLTNILRDLREDAELGRVYLPQEDLERFGYSEAELLAGVRDDRFRALMRFEVERARSFYRSADHLIPLVAPKSRACLATMMGIYERLLDRLEESDFDVFSRRVHLSLLEKVGILLRAWRRHGEERETRSSSA